MRTFLKFVLLILICLPITALGQSDAQKAFEHFKSLVGTWEGKSPTGDKSSVLYQLAAGGTAVMGELQMGDESMTSMFYVDGNRLLMTHFCPSGNQPRMQATISPDLKTVTFDFLDATNLASAQTGHMHKAVYLFTGDADHYSEEWTWKTGDKNAKFHYEMQRKK